MSDSAEGIIRRVELERRDAAQSELKEAIRRLEMLCEDYKSESYRQAWKMGIAFLKSRLAAIC